MNTTFKRLCKDNSGLLLVYCLNYRTICNTTKHQTPIVSLHPLNRCLHCTAILGRWDHVLSVGTVSRKNQRRRRRFWPRLSILPSCSLYILDFFLFLFFLREAVDRWSSRSWSHRVWYRWWYLSSFSVAERVAKQEPSTSDPLRFWKKTPSEIFDALRPCPSK